MSRPNQFLSPEGDIEDYFVDEYWLIDQWVGDTLWTWGQNSVTGTPFGQLGDNTGISRSTPVTTSAGGANWKQVAAGGVHTSAIKTDGTLWVWGGGGNGQLGTNNTSSRCTPVTTFAGGTNWKQVDCGDDFTAAIKTDGTLWTWGANAFGQLGNNTTTNRSTPVTTFAGGNNWKQVKGGELHTSAIKTDGTLWTWGYNFSGQLGDNTSGTNRSTPVTTFAGGNNWKQVKGGDFHTSAIKTDGSLWVWGGNANGQLGNNTSGTNRLTPVTTFAGGTNWKQVAAASNSTLAIKTDGTLWVWGNNSNGSLGINLSSSSISTPVTTFSGGTNWKQVDSSGGHAAAVTSGTDPTFFIS